MGVVGHRVADLHLAGGFHVGDDVADVAGGEDFTRTHLRGEDADFLDLVGFPGGHEFHALALADGAGENADVGNDAAVGVVEGIEDRATQQLVRIFHRCGDAGDDGFEDFLDADAGLGGARNAVLGGDAEDFLKLLLALRHVGGGQVDLVEDRDDEQVLLGGEVEVRDGLGFHALCGVDHQNRAFAGGEGAGDFVGEIDVAGGVEQVKLVGFAVLGRVFHGDRVGLDGDAFFALQIHRIELLGTAFAHRHGARHFHEAVGKRGFPVVDVGDDGEITGQLGGHGQGKVGGVGARESRKSATRHEK